MEKPPVVNTNREAIISLSVDMQFSGEMKIIQDDYLYWDKVKYKTHYEDKGQVWAALKFHRFITSKRILFGGYKFTYPTTDFLQRALHLFDLHIGGTLTSNIGIAETDKAKFMISSIIEESISSSQMEGASTTRKRAKEMIQQEKKPRTHSEQMILNNYITMQHIVQIKNEDLSVEKLLEIHQLISRNTLENPNEEGCFRTNDEIFVANVMKGDVVHQPPLHSELDLLIKDLIVFFNTDTKDFIHPVIKGCIIHFMVGWIHPFTDGNGRTARALFYWYMLKNGYWLTEYLSISKIIKETKNQYEKAYLNTESDDNDLGYFITYHIKTMIKAYEALKVYINKKQNEVVQAAKFLKIAGVNDRMAQIIKIIHDDADRVLNSKELEKRFNVSNFTARQDLKALVLLGFIEEIHVNKKKINYIKSIGFENRVKAIK
ncbi:Fic family protein [Pedobacter sp. CG_S7]|uniref:Fic family protein n=1 Tax=Pedobacter sp. CG_S7 TaxID=3143930 RepID=UPI003398D1EF